MSTISCPHCRQTLQIDPALAGQVVACPACSKKLRLPAAAGGPPKGPPPPAPAFTPLPTPPPAPAASPPPEFVVEMPKPSSVAKAGRDAGSTFRPRNYPAMKVVVYVCYGFACLTALSFVVSEVIVISGGALAAFAGSSIPDVPVATRSVAAGAGIFYFLFMQLVLILYHALAALGFVAAAESIRVWLDIQNNTHEAAHFQKQLYYRQTS